MSDSPKLNTPRIASLDALRGIASFAVCWFHLTNGNPAFLPNGMLKLSGKYGWLGVEVFFVISGFVIPYALKRAGYTLRSYGTFVLKRVVRLDPPYIAAILLAIALGYLSSLAPGFKGESFSFSVPQVLLHLGYLNVFFNYPWLNPVFWTLAIEFQYYLLIGLLFPFVQHENWRVRSFVFAALGLFGFLIPSSSFIFHYIFLFMTGIVTFQYMQGSMSKKSLAGLLVLFGCGACLTAGVPAAVVGFLTACVIAFTRLKNSLFFSLGDISFSLYLLHVPIGGRVINLSLRYAHSMTAKILVLAIATGASIASAYLLYRLIERPSQRWSSRIRYKSPKQTEFKEHVPEAVIAA